jgi:hypothetical protein
VFIQQKGIPSLMSHKIVLGLPPRFIARHYFFGVIIAMLFLSSVHDSREGIDGFSVVLAAINTLVYPYARYLYSWLLNLVVGDNRFKFSGKWFLVWVGYVMVVAIVIWSFSLILASMGMMVLYLEGRRSRDKKRGITQS